jgi:hypothetical protein
MKELKFFRALAICAIAAGVLFVCQNASATAFTTNPAWVAPNNPGIVVDTFPVQYPATGVNVNGYEFTVNKNVKVNALGTYVGNGSTPNPLTSEKIGGTTSHPIINPGNAETLALYEATFATNGKINGWTLIPGTEVTINSTNGTVIDNFDWLSIPQTQLSDAMFQCGTIAKPVTCKTTYEVVVFTNGNFVYYTNVNGDQPDVLDSSVTMLLNGKTSSQGAKNLQLASYYAHHAGIEGVSNPTTDFDYYGPSIGLSPEPSSLFLLGSGLLGLAGLVRRKLRRG